MDSGSLISAGYAALNRQMHARPEGFGGSGKKSAAIVAEYATQIGAARVLDYGCGQGTLRTALKASGRFRARVRIRPFRSARIVLYRW